MAFQPGNGREAEVVRQIAEAHLDPEIAQRWLALARPAVHLVAASGDSPVVARLGGQPRVPTDFTWPTWEPYGPLSYVGEVFLNALQPYDLDVGLPRSGRLLFFFFDENSDTGWSTPLNVTTEEFHRGQVVYVPDAGHLVKTEALGYMAYPETLLTGARGLTFPMGSDHPLVNANFRDPELTPHEWIDHPVNRPPFFNAVWAQVPRPVRQIGGHGSPLQVAVELETAAHVLGSWQAQQDELRTSRHGGPCCCSWSGTRGA